MRNIYLTGFMGTGKTSVGREIARRLGLKFIDLDELIVEKEGRSINDVFASSGEPYFRKVEKEALKGVSQVNGQVVSCGGGAVIDPENIAIMKQSGRFIALFTRPEVIFERVKKETHRPLLNTADPLVRIKELLAIRKPCYDQAEFVIDTSDISVQEAAEMVVKLIND